MGFKIMTKLIVNTETGEETFEELTPADIAQQESDEIAAAKPKVITDPFELAHLAAKQAAEAKLAALGLTPEEAKLLLK